MNFLAGTMTALFLQAALSTPSWSKELEPEMTFVAEPAQDWRDTNMIIARGRITAETPERLRTFLAGLSNSEYVYWIAFDSKGGDLLAALKLGRQIRELNLNTTVMDTRCADEALTAAVCDADRLVKGGVCLSACAYAFLGGAERRIDARYYPKFSTLSRMNLAYGEEEIDNTHARMLGFHRFAMGQFARATADSAADAAIEEATSAQVQYASSELARYFTEMGVSTDFLITIALTDPAKMHFPTIAEMLRTGVLMKKHFERVELLPDGDRVAAVSRFSIRGSFSQQIGFVCQSVGMNAPLPRLVYTRVQWYKGRIWPRQHLAQMPVPISDMTALRFKTGSASPSEPPAGLDTDEKYERWYANSNDPQDIVSAVTLTAGNVHSTEMGSSVALYSDSNWSHFSMPLSKPLIAALLASGTLQVTFDAPNYTGLYQFPTLTFDRVELKTIATALRPCMPA